MIETVERERERGVQVSSPLSPPRRRPKIQCNKVVERAAPRTITPQQSIHISPTRVIRTIVPTKWLQIGVKLPCEKLTTKSVGILPLLLSPLVCRAPSLAPLAATLSRAVLQCPLLPSVGCAVQLSRPVACTCTYGGGLRLSTFPASFVCWPAPTSSSTSGLIDGPQAGWLWQWGHAYELCMEAAATVAAAAAVANPSQPQPGGQWFN